MDTSTEAEILTHVLANTRDAVVFIDGEGNIVRFNGAASQIFGYEATEVLGQPVSLLMSDLHASEHNSYIERYERTGETRAIGRIRTVMGRRADGERFPLELSVTKVDHERVRYAALMRDISKRAMVQQRLENQERMAAVGLLASMFAHEVGNPLNNMFVHAQMLQRKIERLELEVDLGSNINHIMDELRRLTLLLHEFRDLYQPSSMPLGPVSLVVVLEDAMRVVLPEDCDTVELSMQLEPGLPPVLGRSDKLKQVFINLCKNALEAMTEGGRLGIRACVQGGTRVVVDVADSGPGIPSELDPFEPFHSTKPRGSGLGLTVVQQIVTDHEGEISYSSEPGRGTTFRVNLHVAS